MTTTTDDDGVADLNLAASLAAPGPAAPQETDAETPADADAEPATPAAPDAGDATISAYADTVTDAIHTRNSAARNQINDNLDAGQRAIADIIAAATATA